jgi:hypothetical protein
LGKVGYRASNKVHRWIVHRPDSLLATSPTCSINNLAAIVCNAGRISVLVLSPTRELATQVGVLSGQGLCYGALDTGGGASAAWSGVAGNVMQIPLTVPACVLLICESTRAPG